MDAEEQALLNLKEQMTEQQRQDMADMLRAELKRRQKEKMMGTMNSVGPSKAKSKVKSSSLSDSLGAEQVGEIYSELNDKVRGMRLKQLERKVAEAKLQERRLGKLVRQREKSLGRIGNPLNAILPKAKRAESQDLYETSGSHDENWQTPVGGGQSPSRRNFILVGAIISIALLKVLYSSGVVEASLKGSDVSAAEMASDMESSSQDGRIAPKTRAESNVNLTHQQGLIDRRMVGWSHADQQLLTQLDARRVELEKRKAVLDKREVELREQDQALAERLAELRTLSSQLEKKRKEKDHRYEARLEQLANVYGSMSPQEAGPLIARLDDDIALALLERMPSKRMGQILALMNQDRAIALTRSLTDKRSL